MQAAPTTNPNFTSDGSAASSCANYRTLWSIVLTCALTVFACTYSAIHPNIPSPKDSPVRVLLLHLGIMVAALLVPELLAVWALRQWLWARHISTEFRKHFSVHYAWTQTHSFFALMGGFMLYVDGEPYHILLPDHLLDLIRAGSIDVPTLTAKQIRDRSKGNAISKGLIILQVAWFILQLISRAIYHLETTQLEVGTLAFAVLNFITYAVWWNKPLGVQCSHPVYWKSTKAKLAEVCFDKYVYTPINSTPADYVPLSASENDDLEISIEIVAVSLVDSVVRLIGINVMSPRKLQVPTCDSGNVKLERQESNVLTLVGLFMGTIFGGIHCTAWFYPFPTYQEQVLWRVSAIYITFTQWFHLLVYLLFIPKTEKKKTLRLSFIVMFPGILLYVTARVIIFTLMLTTLRNLRPGAFETVSWAYLLPHL
ncbi:uncharacterized protein EDB91DRAFT_1057787 [Suillus paluster]|uniref:uncharacterized protein n=1 Tax=Suillus paluster TaxID=48578 RepID=UPI001B87DCF6|nr:uncharacterized protein EDB91DRAFT_1057787 [Suillus paluster]KAG1732859.1 hypothetical protein EDB91DRAFT_1057787 [Suillus paluster]